MKVKMTNKFFTHCKEGFTEGIRECLAYVDVDSTNKNGNTALHIASLKGYTECIRLLIAVGANLDLKNSSGDTSLHVALLAGHTNIATLLIQSGADINSKNAYGDAPIHIAAKAGYTKVVQMLCAFGCALNLPNDMGLYPLHLAARNGHIDIIRYLCLYGSNVEQRNLDGIKAEILAFKYGHYATGALLNKLRIRNYRESYILQLIPTNKLLAKYNVKFLGCPGTGKSTLIRSLRAGYFLGLFSRSKSQNASSRDYLSTSQMEIDLSSLQSSPDKLPDYECTQGIEISQTSFGSEIVNMWDFSGSNTYYSVYDYFLDHHSFYVIVFNLSLPQSIQYNQCSFWLTFLKSRLRSSEKCVFQILLVGTHADVVNMHKDANGAYYSSSVQKMKNQLANDFPVFLFEDKVILCDAHLPSSRGIRDIKNMIVQRKAIILQIPDDPKIELQSHLSSFYSGQVGRPQDVMRSTGFLDKTVQCLKNWRKDYENFPVITWGNFVKKIHRCVNPVAGSKHIAELITQLSIMGEIFYFRSKSDFEDLIIFDLNWLCSEVIGVLLSVDTIARARVTGCYSEEDFQSFFPQSPADRLLDLLSGFEMCTQCENDEEIEFEFPCYNLVEKLDGLWAAADERYSTPNSCYGGIRLQAPYKMLQTIFIRLQVHLRRATIAWKTPDIDLYQWFQGSKLCLGDTESCITVEEGGKAIEVKIRGTDSIRLNCFYLFNEILNIINEVIFSIAPSLPCERYIMSCQDLRMHSENPYCWPASEVFQAFSSSDGIHSVLRNSHSNKDESLLQILGFGCENVVGDKLIFGADLPITELPGHCLEALAQLLDSSDPHGKDWCVLGVNLNLGHEIASLDNGCTTSKTLALLDIWSKTKEATIGNLTKKLTEIGREDAVKVLLLYAPLYKITLPIDKDKSHKCSNFKICTSDIF